MTKLKRLSRKKPITPNSIIRSAIRGNIWLRSRERVQALKDTNYCCSMCGVKNSKAKGREVTVEVHHTKEPNWERIFAVIREELLDPKILLPVCVECHDKIHGDD